MSRSFTPLETARPQPLRGASARARFLTGFAPTYRQAGSSSFTLIELLIVIAVVAILSVVVILALNPAELLKQARDSARLSDINTINKALALYQVDNPQGAFGTASTTYISYPDSSSSCANIGVSTSTIASGYALACSASLSYQKIDGTGWIPVNLSAITGGAPISQLPKDPVNTTSSNNYYIYHGNSSNWAITALLESQKYLAQSAEKDGGYDPGRFEKGSSLALISEGEGLVGWWDFEEGLGSTTSTDKSGNSNNGAWNGTGTHYADGKVGMYAGSFNGTNDYLTATHNASLNISSPYAISLWIRLNSVSDQHHRFINKGNLANGFWTFLHEQNSQFRSQPFFGGGYQTAGLFSATVPLAGQWYHFAVTSNKNTAYFYINGSLEDTSTETYDATLPTNTNPLSIGRSEIWDTGNNHYGSLDDVRIYSRALSAAEIAAIYNATK